MNNNNFKDTVEYTYEKDKFFIYAGSLYNVLGITDISLEQWILNVVNDKYHQDDIINDENIVLVTVPYAKELAYIANTENTDAVRVRLIEIANLDPAEDAAENIVLEEYKVKRQVVSELISFFSATGGFNGASAYRFIRLVTERIVSIKDNTKLRLTLLREVSNALKEFRNNTYKYSCPSSFAKLTEYVYDTYISLSNSARGGQENRINFLEKDIERLQDEIERLQEQLNAKQESPVQMDGNTIKALRDFLDKISE